MAEIRLAKLPDRTPVKLTISVSPSLNQALIDYAAFYGRAYGTNEPVQDLVSAMLEAFMASDRAFARSRTDRG